MVEQTQEVAAVDILEVQPAREPGLVLTTPRQSRGRAVAEEQGVEIDVEVDMDHELFCPRPGAGAESISPLALSIAPAPAPARAHAESTFKIDALQPPRRRLGGIVTGAMAVAVCILVAAGVRARMVEPPADQVSVAVPAKAVAAAAAQPWRAAEAAPTSGTITSRGGALFVDGARISAKSAVVSCGHHQLRAGRGKAHDVDVPCGGTLLVDRQGNATVR